jgi:hypothetical protein
VCYWEDDNVQAEDADFSEGANSASLRQAQVNFKRLGVSDPRFSQLVGAPRSDELRDPSWVRHS